MMKLFKCITCFVFLCFSWQAFAYEWQKDGERLTFDVYWSFVYVGQAELLLENASHDYKIIGRAWTDDKYNTLYTLRDRVTMEGVHTEGQPFLSDYYHAELNENDYRANKWVKFDHQKNISTYTNSYKNLKPTQRSIDTHARDMISVLYALRALHADAKVGDAFTLPVVHYDRKYTYTLRVLEKEFMETDHGKKEVFEIQPILTRDDEKNKKDKDNLRLWVTADGQFIPVKIEIKLKFGAFRAVLSEMGDAQSKSFAPLSIPENGAINLKQKRGVLNNDVFNN